MSEQSDFRTEKQLQDFSRACYKLRSNLYRNSFRLCGNAEDADDCVQETLIQAFKNISRFRGNSSLNTWLFAINNNVCRSRIGKRKRTPAIPLDEDIAVNSVIQEDESQITVEVGMLLGQMPDHVRQAFLLQSEGATLVEIAELLGYKESTLRNHMKKYSERVRSAVEAGDSRL